MDYEIRHIGILANYCIGATLIDILQHNYEINYCNIIKSKAEFLIHFEAWAKLAQQ